MMLSSSSLQPRRRLLVLVCCIMMIIPSPCFGIINGYDAKKDEFPWFVTIGDIGEYCGGTLLTERHVLTAGHCFLGDETNLNNFFGGTQTLDIPFVNVGVYSTTRDKSANKGERINIDCVTIHPKFSAGGFATKGFFNDIAVVKLKEPTTMITNGKFIILNNNTNYPSSNSLRRGEGKGKETLTTIGFGGQKTLEAWLGADPPATLQKVDLQYTSMAECQESWPCVNSQNHLCANQPSPTEKREGFCQGDSGGPLLDSNNVQIGINSFLGVVCGSETPDVFTPIAQYYDWIQEQLTSNTCDPKTALSNEFSTSPFFTDIPATCESNAFSSYFTLMQNMIVAGKQEFKSFFVSSENANGNEDPDISLDDEEENNKNNQDVP